MSYLVGKTQLLALRDEYRRKLGDRFSLRDFHDRLVAEGCTRFENHIVETPEN